MIDTDTVTLTSSLAIKAQSIAVATGAQGFRDMDGVLGIGPADLTASVVSTKQTVPTVTDTLFAQGAISSNSVGIFFEPTTSEGTVNGELTFGGTDSTRYTGEITFTPITTTAPARKYWGINQSLSYGEGQGSTTLLPGSAGIVDTGSTLILIASDAFQKYKQATGAELDSDTGLLTVTEDQYANMRSLFFNIGVFLFVI